MLHDRKGKFHGMHFPILILKDFPFMLFLCFLGLCSLSLAWTARPRPGPQPSEHMSPGPLSASWASCPWQLATHPHTLPVGPSATLTSLPSRPWALRLAFQPCPIQPLLVTVPSPTRDPARRPHTQVTVPCSGSTPTTSHNCCPLS